MYNAIGISNGAEFLEHGLVGWLHSFKRHVRTDKVAVNVTTTPPMMVGLIGECDWIECARSKSMCIFSLTDMLASYCMAMWVMRESVSFLYCTSEEASHIILEVVVDTRGVMFCPPPLVIEKLEMLRTCLHCEDNFTIPQAFSKHVPFMRGNIAASSALNVATSTAHVGCYSVNLGTRPGIPVVASSSKYLPSSGKCPVVSDAMRSAVLHMALFKSDDLAIWDHSIFIECLDRRQAVIERPRIYIPGPTAHLPPKRAKRRVAFKRKRQLIKSKPDRSSTKRKRVIEGGDDLHSIKSIAASLEMLATHAIQTTRHTPYSRLPRRERPPARLDGSTGNLHYEATQPSTRSM